MASNSHVFGGPHATLTEMENHRGNGHGRGRAMYQQDEHQHLFQNVPIPVFLGGNGGINDARMQDNAFNARMLNERRMDSAMSHSGQSSTSTTSYYGGKKSNKDKEMVLKTPVSLLNEVCAKAHVEPIFELKDDGPPHAKLFSCSVKVERQGCTWEGIGQSNNKKDAKQDAAKNLLLTMDNNVERMLAPPKPTPSSSSTMDSASLDALIETDPDPEGNPVGELNDLTLKLKRLPPEYEEIGEEGKPHERVYTIACKLGSQIVEHGTGRTKKHAKKAAAFKVKQKLVEVMQKADEDAASASPKDIGVGGVDDPDSMGDIVSLLRNASITKGKKKSKSKKSLINGDEQWKLSEWLTEFKERSGEKLQSLQEPNPNMSDPAKLLREVAEEQKFKVEYVDVVKSETDELFSCIVSIGFEPVAIFLGRGGSKTQARKNAAKSTLEFLTIAIGR